MGKLTQSYVHGASAVPLIGDTIGVHFDQAVARWRLEQARHLTAQRNTDQATNQLRSGPETGFAGGPK